MFCAEKNRSVKTSFSNVPLSAVRVLVPCSTGRECDCLRLDAVTDIVPSPELVVCFSKSLG
jgi:hypothetical protein